MPVAITPLLLTFNEAPNLARTLAQLRWAQRIVVVDSFSTDDTEAIACRFPNVEFLRRKFDDHTSQWNFGLDQITSGWVLSLDADYVLSAELVVELQQFEPSAAAQGYAAHFVYCIHGRPLRGSLYPPRVVLFRAGHARYEQDGHTQRLRFEGAPGALVGPILHDDRKPLAHWLWAQDRYAALEVQKLLAAPAGSLPWQDRLRKMILPAPFMVFAYTLLVKGMIFQGWPGWAYTLQRTVAEIILSLRLIEKKLAGSA
jgi:glycosyltransferase involved in cell wall biosynthesis